MKTKGWERDDEGHQSKLTAEKLEVLDEKTDEEQEEEMAKLLKMIVLN